MVLIGFMIGNLFLSVLIAMIIWMKKLFRKKGSLRFQYQIWFVLMFALILFLIPVLFGKFTEIPALASGSDFLPKLSNPWGSNSQKILYALGESGDWSDDFVEIADPKIEMVLISGFTLLWLLGALGVMGFYLWGRKMLRTIKRSAALPTEDINTIFKRCCLMTSMNHKVQLLQSDLITTPLSFGCIHPCILLPDSMVQQSAQASLEHIFLHELMHIKHQDLWMNFCICAEQILYWFHPLVWCAFSRMRRDREAYCDWLVLNFYDTEEERLNYGDTLLRFAGKGNRIMIDTANGLADHKNDLKYRIEQITNFKKETKASKTICHCVIAMLLLITMTQLPVLAAFANDFDLTYKPDHQMTVIEKDYSDLFEEALGCAILYDLQNDVYEVYNPSVMTKRIAPCSTYKIYSALNALEQGIITPESHTLLWDGIDRERSAWNENQNLNLAMSNSVNWYFQLLDKMSGAEELETFYAKIGYGNGYVGNDTESYWAGNGLKISPLEQVELLAKLYDNDFGFEEENVEAVKRAICLLSENGNRLYGKTGTGRSGDQDVSGWFIGYLETSDHTYFFSVYLQDDSGANGAAAVQITYDIFEKMNLSL